MSSFVLRPFVFRFSFFACLIGLLACAPDRSVPSRIVAHAREQTSWGTAYDPSYVKIAYPGGDLPKTKGVCTDVVIRALRSVGRDLQKLVHEDRKARPAAYPRAGKLDSSIDHRRCPNLIAYFKKHGRTQTTRTEAPFKDRWKPGNLVFWKLDNGRDHVGILTDKTDENGLPWAVHNLSTTLEEPVLTRWKIVGHFRYPP